MIKSVYDNMSSNDFKQKFFVGIEDDVTNLSLKYGAPINVLPKGTKQFIFWGLGGDGTIGANKAAIKTLGIEANMEVQG